MGEPMRCRALFACAVVVVGAWVGSAAAEAEEGGGAPPEAIASPTPVAPAPDASPEPGASAPPLPAETPPAETKAPEGTSADAAAPGTPAAATDGGAPAAAAPASATEAPAGGSPGAAPADPLPIVPRPRPARAEMVTGPPTLYGYSGGLRVVSASPTSWLAANVVVAGEWFSIPGYLIEGKKHHHNGASFTVNVALLKYLEVASTILGSTHHDGGTNPVFIAAIGDADVSGRVVLPVFHRGSFRLCLGARGGAKLMQGSIDAEDPEARPELIRSPYGFGLLSIEGGPARLSLNGGFMEDRSRELVADDFDFDLQPAEAYAYGVSRYDAYLGGVALDFPRWRFAPFVEASGRSDIGADGDPAIVGTGGLRAQSADRQATFFVAGDLGLMGKKVVPGRLRAPEWQVVGGFSISWGQRLPSRSPLLPPAIPIARAPASPAALPEVADYIAVKKGVLVGSIVEDATGKAVPGATIELDDGSSVVANADGRFDATGLKLGLAFLTVRHPGFAEKRAVYSVTERRDNALELRLLRPEEAIRVARAAAVPIEDAAAGATPGAIVGAAVATARVADGAAVTTTAATDGAADATSGVADGAAATTPAAAAATTPAAAAPVAAGGPVPSLTVEVPLDAVAGAADVATGSASAATGVAGTGLAAAATAGETTSLLAAPLDVAATVVSSLPVAAAGLLLAVPSLLSGGDGGAPGPSSGGTAGLASGVAAGPVSVAAPVAAVAAVPDAPTASPAAAPAVGSASGAPGTDPAATLAVAPGAPVVALAPAAASELPIAAAVASAPTLPVVPRVLILPPPRPRPGPEAKLLPVTARWPAASRRGLSWRRMPLP